MKLNINKRTGLILTCLALNFGQVLFAQGPPPPEGGGGNPGAPPIGVPLDSNAIYFLVAAGLLYLLFHYRHLFLKKEALNKTH